MARDNISVHLPVGDVTNSAEVILVTKKAVVQANGIKIEHALDNKNNSLQIFIENTANADSVAKIKAGDNYPSAMLGDLDVAVGKAAITAIILEDIARFENRDNSINIDFASGFTGNIWAVGKRAGLDPQYQPATRG